MLVGNVSTTVLSLCNCYYESLEEDTLSVTVSVANNRKLCAGKYSGTQRNCTTTKQDIMELRYVNWLLVLCSLSYSKL